MWDDIIIGDATSDRLCSATKVFEIDFNPHSIAQNSLSYWISLHDPNIGMKVYKDTKEGMHITKLIFEKCSAETLYLYLFGLAMKRMAPERMIKILQDSVAEAEKEGYNSAKEELRNWLGVNRY